MIGAARGLSGAAVRAGERHARAEADPEGVRRRGRLHRSDGGIRRRDHPRQADVRGESRTCTSTRTSTTTRATGGRTTTRRRRRSSSRPAGASRISWPASARAARSSGAGRRLREFNPAIRLISVQPDSPLHGLEGLKHMATAIVPGIYDPALADEDIGVSTEEAFELTRGWRRQGLFVGISSGANLAGALRVARRTSRRGRRRGLLRRRREVSVRALLGRGPTTEATLMALALQAGVDEAIRAHGVETYPNECCGALYRPRRRRHGDVRAAEHDRGRAAAPVSRAAAGLSRGRAAGDASWRPSCSGSIIRTRIIRRGRRSTISTTRGRSSRTSSSPSAPARPKT